MMRLFLACALMATACTDWHDVSLGADQHDVAPDGSDDDDSDDDDDDEPASDDRGALNAGMLDGGSDASASPVAHSFR